MPIKTTTKLKEEREDNSVSRPMLSLEQSRTILNQNGIEYTDEEILIIREFMYCVAEITAKHYQRIKENNSKVISITQTDQDEATSLSLHSGKYRRTG